MKSSEKSGVGVAVASPIVALAGDVVAVAVGEGAVVGEIELCVGVLLAACEMVLLLLVSHASKKILLPARRSSRQITPVSNRNGMGWCFFSSVIDNGTPHLNTHTTTNLYRMGYCLTESAYSERILMLI